MPLRPPLLAALGAFALFAGQPAAAKLPPPSPEVQAKADEAKAKTAWSDKVAAFKLCQAQDRVAAQYREKAGTNAKPAAETPACTDPGPFSPQANASPPLEAAGAHSPARTAAQPHNEKATDAEQRGDSKK
jgi:hypothetical protein